MSSPFVRSGTWSRTNNGPTPGLSMQHAAAWNSRKTTLPHRMQFVIVGQKSQTSEPQSECRTIPDVDDITPFPGYDIDEFIPAAQPCSPPPSNPGEALGALHQIEVWNGDLVPTAGNEDISGELNHSTPPYVVEGQAAPPYNTAGALHDATLVHQG
ncbi:hypothetical protein B0H34DRAFT_800836 [Crassisporium funariophilum]|nr:hypothetical protein B0H34DRAFT_800836 [Crassisporium funariophilum]